MLVSMSVVNITQLGKVVESGCPHSPPSSAEVKECVELYLHLSSTSSWRGA